MCVCVCVRVSTVNSLDLSNSYLSSHVKLLANQYILSKTAYDCVTVVFKFDTNTDNDKNSNAKAYHIYYEIGKNLCTLELRSSQQTYAAQRM